MTGLSHTAARIHITSRIPKKENPRTIQLTAGLARKFALLLLRPFALKVEQS